MSPFDSWTRLRSSIASLFVRFRRRFARSRPSQTICLYGCSDDDVQAIIDKFPGEARIATFTAGSLDRVTVYSPRSKYDLRDHEDAVRALVTTPGRYLVFYPPVGFLVQVLEDGDPASKERKLLQWLETTGADSYVCPQSSQQRDYWINLFLAKGDPALVEPPVGRMKGASMRRRLAARHS